MYHKSFGYCIYIYTRSN